MDEQLKITFLGTGTSQGIPVIACQCKVCTSPDKRDTRLRASLLIEVGSETIVIDTGPDFRQQMLTNKVNDISAVLFTHEHKDHVAGLDDVRPFNFIHKKAIEVYAEKRVQEALKREYAYVFAEYRYPGIPRINMNIIENKDFKVGGVEITPVRAFHYKLPVFGFRIGDFCYLTDVKSIPQEEIVKLKGLKVLVLNALQKEEHISHMNLSEALELISMVNPEKAFLTHLNHRFGLHAIEETLLPEIVFIAYDNLSFLV
jgi:phosphoribosyl 1,2-cyclic phosphate phosphodiesterase